MRNKYWAMYECILDSKFYYWHYRARSVKIDNIINGFCAIASAFSISTWLIWKKHSWLWAIVIAISQIIEAIRHLLPFSRQITAINYFYPDLKLLVDEIDHDWDRVDDLSDNEISEIIYAYHKKFDILESKYIGSTYFPRSKKIEKKAIEDRKNYFFQKYRVDTVEERDVTI